MQNPGFRFWVLLDVWPSKHTGESYKKFANSCYTQYITSIPLYIQTTCISVALKDLYIFIQMPYLLFTPYHIMWPRISAPPKMVTSSSLFLATIYNQSQLVERKHVARYWSINTVAMAVPLSTPLSISYYNEINGGHIGSSVVWRRGYASPVLPLFHT